ncbi:alpha/beta hydrolase [Oceanobacillus rekensis]|uniref:alpha/beta hydrolase n=1 Tax=Oceanobacillus rekensis TaxID=937927 RepID=UPI000B430FE2|nr:alpha/beta hydrolase [Oceanobacillus rekensis]
MESSFWLTMEDGTEVYCKKWYVDGNKPKAIIQLAHGMAEHINRYKEFANFLLKKGFFVIGNDHRGHGKTAEKSGVQGYFSDKDGFTKTTNDLYEITMNVKEFYPDTPIFLLGHSMGSFLVRNYLQEYSAEIHGVILSGTGYYSKTISIAGKSLAYFLSPKKESNLLNQLAFSSNNKKISDQKNGYEWLTREETVVKKYRDDPLCGFIPTGRFFFDLLSGIISMQNKKRNKMIQKDLPLLIISGDADPIGDYGKGIWKTADIYQKAGLQDISIMLFTDGRHELLNETNREEVYDALYRWTKQQLT